MRTTLNLTAVNLAGVFAVHELLHEGTTPSVGCGVDEIHGNEAVGMDIPVDKDGVWRQVLEEGNGHGRKGWAVGAGPIEHRSEPSRGFRRIEADDSTGNRFRASRANTEKITRYCLSHSTSQVQRGGSCSSGPTGQTLPITLVDSNFPTDSRSHHFTIRRNHPSARTIRYPRSKTRHFRRLLRRDQEFHFQDHVRRCKSTRT